MNVLCQGVLLVLGQGMMMPTITDIYVWGCQCWVSKWYSLSDRAGIITYHTFSCSHAVLCVPFACLAHSLTQEKVTSGNEEDHEGHSALHRVVAGKAEAERKVTVQVRALVAEAVVWHGLWG